MDTFLSVLVTGAGATALVDLWALLRARLFGVSPPDYALVGRWLAHMTRGRFRHAAIAQSASMRGEHAIGWISHYAIGVVFASLLLATEAIEWLARPTLAPALVVGLATVAAPFLLMQPGMGAGIAASRTRAPAVARFHSVVSHAVFGLGLYAAGRLANLTLG